MLKKLLKYEFKSSALFFYISYSIVLILAVLARLSMIVYASDAMITAMALTHVLFIFSSIGVFIVPFIISVQSFKKRLLTDEAYLSFSLPVKIKHHVLAKLIIAVISNFASYIVVFLAVVIRFGNYEFFIGLGKILGYLGQFFSYWFTESPLQTTLFSIEYIIMIVVGFFNLILFCYLSMIFTQKLQKRKFLVSFIVIGVVYAGLGLFSSLLYAISTVISKIKNPLLATHITIWVVIAVSVLIGWLFWKLIINRLSKHLNIY